MAYLIFALGKQVNLSAPNDPKVFRFGQLFEFRIGKSFPFQEIRFECKDTKYILTMYLFQGRFFAKKS